MRRLMVLLLAMMPVAACEMEEIPVEEQKDEAFADVRFSAELSGQTRSSISPDEDIIYDINVYAYRNGVLVDEVYSTSLEDVVLRLPVGYAYDIYAVANMGRQSPDAIEEKFVDEFAYAISDLSEISGCIPMSCVNRNVSIGKNTKDVRLLMERSAAKIILSVDKESILKGLRIDSVRLCQSPTVLRPFRWHGKGGSRAESSDEVMAGDFATDMDLAVLNSGEPVILYALENCQGILLPDNVNPMEKIPHRIGGKDALCTYLEVSATFGSEGILEGGVNYRIYLGLDSTSSFDVPGNSCIDISLLLTDGGLRNMSWKVDADVSVRDGYIYGYVSEGMHPVTDLYVGEKILYELELAEDLLEYVGGDLAGCSLSFLVDGEVSDGVSVDVISTDDDLLQAELSCRKSVSGELVLYGPDGECLGCVEKNVSVKVPGVIFSEYHAWQEDEAVEALSFIPECEINGAPAEFYLYFVDEEGRNLNCVQSYAFDSQMFDFQGIDFELGENSAAGIRSECEAVNVGLPGGAAACVRVFCDNDGSDHSVNVQLADLYDLGRPVSVEFEEDSFGIAREVSVQIAIPQMTVTLVDNGWAKYHDSQLSVIVDNPSNLPLQVSAWQLIVTNTDYGAVDEVYVENNLVLEPMNYMTGDFYNGNPPLYGSKASFTSERNEYGTSALARGDLLVYPLEGISTNNLIKAINYDKRGHRQMMHMLDVVLNGNAIKDGDVVFEDKASDGSVVYDYIYFSEDSWNYKGAEFFSGGKAVSSSGRWPYDYPELNARGLDGLYQRYAAGQAVYVTFNYNTSYGKFMLLTNSKNAIHDFNISINYQGQVNGYVQTYPNGTRRDPQDNHCSVQFDHVTTGLPFKVGSTFVWADDGKVKEAIGGIYEFSYKDSPKAFGSDSYMHRAHPVDVDLNVSCAVEGDSGNELFPLVVDWKFTDITYYHEQDDANYKCALNVVSEGFSIVVVSPK